MWPAFEYTSRPASSMRIRKKVANCCMPSRRQQRPLMLETMSAADVSHVVCVRSDACSMAVSSAAGMPLPSTSATASSNASPDGTTS